MIIKSDKKIIKNMGFLEDQQGIINRFIREKGGWNTHLENTKQFIIDAIQNISPKENVIVLGTGWLLDVPYLELSQSFKNCYFVDISHPAQIKHKLRKHTNIKLIKYDITGGIIQNTYNAIKKYQKKNEKIPIKNLLKKPENWGVAPEIKPNLVISVNLLNQLDILITEKLKKYDIYTENEIAAFKKAIQQIHVNTLKENKAILITDYKENQFDDNDKKINEKKLIFVELPPKKQTWTWNFDKNKTYYTDRNTEFEVMAVKF